MHRRGTPPKLNQHSLSFPKRQGQNPVLTEEFRQQSSKNCSRGLKCVSRPGWLGHGPGDPLDSLLAEAEGQI